MDGKEEARMENHFLSCACNKDGCRRWVSCFGTVEVEVSPVEVVLTLWDIQTEMSIGSYK